MSLPTKKPTVTPYQRRRTKLCMSVLQLQHPLPHGDITIAGVFPLEVYRMVSVSKTEITASPGLHSRCHFLKCTQDRVRNDIERNRKGYIGGVGSGE